MSASTLRLAAGPCSVRSGAQKLSYGALRSELKLENIYFSATRLGFFWGGRMFVGFLNAFPEAERVRQGRSPRA